MCLIGHHSANRRSAADLSVTDRWARISDSWRRMENELLGPGSAWGNACFDSADEKEKDTDKDREKRVYWQIDKVEDAQRMRRYA